MPLTLLAPALLSAVVPELARRKVPLPNLEALCAAGSITLVPASAEQWLCERLGLEPGAEPPVAALRRAAEIAAGPDVENRYWLCADPVATTMGVDSVRIDGVVTDLSLPEAAAMAAALSGFFAQDGLAFVAASANRWYVHGATPQQIATTPLWRAIGGSMLHQLPTGPDAPAWRARLNEAQMLLHAHPVNAAREARRLPPVASLWWWGGGALSAPGPAAFDTVTGGPRWVGALCAAGGVEFRPAGSDPAPRFATGARRALLIVDDDWEHAALTPDALARWDAAWFGPLRAALETGELNGATLAFPWDAGLLCVAVRHQKRSLWQRWFGAGGSAPPPLAVTLKTFEP